MPRNNTLPKTSTHFEGVVTLHKGSWDFLSFSLVINVVDIHWVQWGKMRKKEWGFEKWNACEEWSFYFLKHPPGMDILLSKMLIKSKHFAFQNVCLLWMKNSTLLHYLQNLVEIFLYVFSVQHFQTSCWSLLQRPSKVTYRLIFIVSLPFATSLTY